MDAFQFQYLVGGAVFLIGMIYAFKQGFIGLTGRGFRNLVVMLAGLVFFMAIQGYLQYAQMPGAPEQVAPGELPERERIGTFFDYGVMITYFLAILAIGTFYGRRQKTTKDFFFAGQRFSWWLIALSLVATTVGSYSFVKYSKVAYEYGLSSTQTYLNDWFWIPFFAFGWLPILYFSRVTSIPEYFERRFGSASRMMVTILLLAYLIGYVGVNLFTMGTALNILLGWNIWTAAAIVATISAIYVTFGGQTSVIMTDLFQGLMLLGTGFLLLVLGIHYMGGFDDFWLNLPRGHRLAFANFNEDPGFPSVGIFWQDAMANTAMFYFINQGILMRFMSAKSVNEGRKAALIVPIVLMPLAAIAVASGGWVGRALEHAGLIPHGMTGDTAFFITAEFLSQPGVFGLVMAALTAALMSTVDTLITAIAAIIVNDVYKPYIRPKASEKQLLSVARVTSVAVMIFGLILVPVFMQFESIYSAHGAFTAAVTPPLVVALLCAVFWRRYTRQAAFWTMAGGAVAIIISIAEPSIVAPFSFGVPATTVDTFWEGMRQYKFTRAFFGLAVSGFIAVTVTLFTKPESKERQKGLVWGTIKDALTAYKGSPGEEVYNAKSLATIKALPDDRHHEHTDLPIVSLSRPLADAIRAGANDMIYVTDKRRWLGGLHSFHAIVGDIVEDLDVAEVQMGPSALELLRAEKRMDKPVRVERLY